MYKIFISSIFFSIIFCSYSWEKSPASKYIDLSLNHMYNYQFDSTFYYLKIADKIDNQNPLSPFLHTTAAWMLIQSKDGVDSSYTQIDKSLKKNIPLYKKLIK